MGELPEAASAASIGLPDEKELAGLVNLALNKPAAQSSLSRWSRREGAQGAVNGRKTGRYGFHTDNEAQPWWRVDLGATLPISWILLWNREGPNADRARNLEIQLSDDDAQWDTVAATGTLAFGGVSDNRPLAVRCAGRQARFVRILRREAGPLHLDEVEVFGPPKPDADPLPELYRRLGEDPALAETRRHGRNAMELRFGPLPAEGPPLRSITLRQFGRFGNNVVQLVHAIHFAETHGVSRIHLGGLQLPGFRETRRIGDIEFSTAKADGRAGPDLLATLYFTKAFKTTFERFGDAALLRIARDYIRPLLLGSFAVRPPREEPTLHIHLRAGDVFKASPHPLYGQPPLAFYVMAVQDAVRRSGVRRVVLVYQDETNPCIAALKSWLAEQGIAYEVQSTTFDEDVAELLSARHLVVANGTFAVPLFLMSTALRQVYGFRGLTYAGYLKAAGIEGFVVTDKGGRYIPEDGWKNTPEQRQLMLDYPVGRLRLGHPKD